MEKKFQLKGRTTSLGYVSVYLDVKQLYMKNILDVIKFKGGGLKIFRKVFEIFLNVYVLEVFFRKKWECIVTQI